MARVRTYGSYADAFGEWRRLGIPEGTLGRFDLGSKVFIFLDHIDRDEVEMLRQEASSRGGVVYHCRGDRALLLIAPLALEGLLMSGPSPRVIEAGEALRNRYDPEPPIFEWNGGSLDLSRPRVMGILNVTPDSFSDGGRHQDVDLAVARAAEMKEEGADVIDVGGESTRPGSSPISADVEWSRISVVVRRVVDEVGLPVSVDTRRPDVAKKALSAGAQLVNDISGLKDEMIDVVKSSGAGAFIMHMRGEPSTMQADTRYIDPVGDTYAFLEDRMSRALEMGVRAESLAIDPGLGFGKDLQGNLEIMSRLEEYRSMGRPVLLGASRKSFLGTIAGGTPSDRLEASLAAAAIGCWQGVHMFRVHDVRQTVRTLSSVQAMKRGINRT